MSMQNSLNNNFSVSKHAKIVGKFRKNIIELVTEENKSSPLFLDFANNFYHYVPIDYIEPKKAQIFAEFLEEAYELAQIRKPNSPSLKIDLESHTKGRSRLSVILIDDNKQFILDSLKSAFSKFNIEFTYVLHPVMQVKRGDNGELLKIISGDDSVQESYVVLRAYGFFDEVFVEQIEKELKQVVKQVTQTNDIWPELLAKLDTVNNHIGSSQTIDGVGCNIDNTELSNFLTWMRNGNFIFLSYVDYSINSDDKVTLDKKLGLDYSWDMGLENKIYEAIEFSKQVENCKDLVAMGKLKHLSPVHRNNFIDYIIVKSFDQDGNYIGGVAFLGLYGLGLYYQSIINIPILRQKMNLVSERSSFSWESYNGKRFRAILESLPREELMEVGIEDLHSTCTHILSALVADRLKLFLRQEDSGQFINAMIFLDRERLTPETQEQIEQYLQRKLDAKILDISSILNFFCSQGLLIVLKTLPSLYLKIS